MSANIICQILPCESNSFNRWKMYRKTEVWSSLFAKQKDCMWFISHLEKEVPPYSSATKPSLITQNWMYPLHRMRGSKSCLIQRHFRPLATWASSERPHSLIFRGAEPKRHPPEVTNPTCFAVRLQCPSWNQRQGLQEYPIKKTELWGKRMIRCLKSYLGINFLYPHLSYVS